MKKLIKFVALPLVLAVMSLGVAQAATPPGVKVSATGLAQGGSNVTFTWRAPATATYKVHVQVPSNGTASNALYRVYPKGNAAGSTACSSTDATYPCFEISVNQLLINQVILSNAWMQLTLNNKPSTQWTFTKAGFVSVNPSNLVKTENLSVAAVSFEKIASGLSIGKTYQGGIIFYLDSTKQHGLIAAPTDQSTGIQWYNGSFTTTGATGTAVGTGKANTAAIIKSQGAGSYAAKVCDDLVVGQYQDWYLPSKDELRLMLGNIGQNDLLGNIGGFVDNFFWSSSEMDNDYAWNWLFNSNAQYYIHKSNTLRVRAIRSF